MKQHRRKRIILCIYKYQVQSVNAANSKCKNCTLEKVAVPDLLKERMENAAASGLYVLEKSFLER